MADTLKRKEVEEMIREFYRLGEVRLFPGLNVNDRVANVFTTMLLEAQKCTKAVVLVPQPPAGRPTVLWLAYNVARSAIQSASGNISVTCVKGVIYNWGPELQRASMGV